MGLVDRHIGRSRGNTELHDGGGEGCLMICRLSGQQELSQSSRTIGKGKEE